VNEPCSDVVWTALEALSNAPTAMQNTGDTHDTSLNVEFVIPLGPDVAAIVQVVTAAARGVSTNRAATTAMITALV
jgi:hypothetical protein